MCPLPAAHAANQAQARTLADIVLGGDGTDETRQKVGAKTRLKVLAPRLAAARQAYAASQANTDEDLAGRVRYSRSDSTKANDASFASIITALLKEAAPLAKALEKREFTADDLAETTCLRARFENKHTSQRTTVVAGATDRKRLIALLRRNATLIKQMRVQLKPYETSATKHEVWERFQGYTKLIILGGAAPKATRPPGPPPKLLQKQKAPLVAGLSLPKSFSGFSEVTPRPFFAGCLRLKSSKPNKQPRKNALPATGPEGRLSFG